MYKYTSACGVDDSSYSIRYDRRDNNIRYVHLSCIDMIYILYIQYILCIHIISFDDPENR